MLAAQYRHESRTAQATVGDAGVAEQTAMQTNGEHQVLLVVNVVWKCLAQVIFVTTHQMRRHAGRRETVSFDPGEFAIRSPGIEVQAEEKRSVGILSDRDAVEQIDLGISGAGEDHFPAARLEQWLEPQCPIEGVTLFGGGGRDRSRASVGATMAWIKHDDALGHAVIWRIDQWLKRFPGIKRLNIRQAIYNLRREAKPVFKSGILADAAADLHGQG